ncbi:hypothetical protein OIU84_004594 [Salix udensis]|uniref:Uncharacterized protein n=1 Tax=Salix udensis TaxID=889485 RepID=A0AAD6K4E7_9ROSI|nr:hypothetical protein OIU84_004594 [Salix udensis]
MVLALASAVVLSPLYVKRRNDETKWSSGFVLPMVLAGLVIAIRTTSSSMSVRRGSRASFHSISRSILGAENWELILGTRWSLSDAYACAFMARLCSRIFLEIGERKPAFSFNLCLIFWFRLLANHIK